MQDRPIVKVHLWSGLRAFTGGQEVVEPEPELEFYRIAPIFQGSGERTVSGLRGSPEPQLVLGRSESGQIVLVSKDSHRKITFVRHRRGVKTELDST